MAEKNCENCAREDCAFIPPSGGVHCGYWKSDTPAVNRWIQCSERLPETGTDVIVYYPYWQESPVQIAHLQHDYYLWETSDGEYNLPAKAVTHWMPLPEPPESE